MDKDSLFDQAARIVVETQSGSASMLQRKFKIGYNRAGNLIDQLQAAGIIVPFDGEKPREVLIKDIPTLEKKLVELNLFTGNTQKIDINKVTTEVHCPKCGSVSVTAQKRGFSVPNAIVGAVFTLGIGALAGSIGKNKINITCLSCGHQFKPGQGI